MGKTVKLPKTECCVSSSRCSRCPIRMLKEGTLPPGYGVHKRKLVRVDASGKSPRPWSAKSEKKISKTELADAMKAARKAAKQKKARAA